MRIAEGVEAIELPMRFAGAESTVYPVLLRDAGGEATLVDAGLPGQAAAIEERLRWHGVPLTALRRIILTHQDLDHIGSAQALADASGAEVMAHAADAPYIRGDRRPIKLDPRRYEERLKGQPKSEREAVMRIVADPPRVPVDRLLDDGAKLPWHGGIVVIHTPGHTPGHVSLYLAASRVLIAGDALRSENGVLVGPNPGATPDLPEATRSLRKLVALAIDGVICYHGGPAGPDAAERLRALAS